MTANRASGLFFVLFGLALYALVIPNETELVDYGWVRPQTVPNVAALMLTALGLKQTLLPEGSVDLPWRHVLRAGLFLGLAALTVFVMSRVGFLYAAPVFALALMLLVGERRPVWLIAGAAVVPVLIWLAATAVLDRPLP